MVADANHVNCANHAKVRLFSYFLTMPRTSSSRMIRNSSPSILISVPEYLPKRTLSPALTSSGKTLPSSLDLPLPTEMTWPSWGFSLALSGMMIPPRIVSPSSRRRTRMRSWRGVNVVVTDVDAIASLLLHTRAGLSPVCGLFNENHWNRQNVDPELNRQTDRAVPLTRCWHSSLPIANDRQLDSSLSRGPPQYMSVVD